MKFLSGWKSVLYTVLSLQSWGGGLATSKKRQLKRVSIPNRRNLRRGKPCVRSSEPSKHLSALNPSPDDLASIGQPNA